MMNKYMELARVRDFGGVISDSITFFRDNIRGLLRPLLLIGGMFLLALIAASLIQQLKVFRMLAWAAGPSPENLSAMGNMFSLEYFLVIIFSFFCYCTFSLVTLAYMAVYKDNGGEKSSVEEVWEVYRRRALAVYMTGLLLLVIMLAATVLLIIPGIYLMPVLSLVFPVMVFEGVGLYDALGRAFKLIRNNWWNTFGLLIVIGIITGVVMSIVSLPATALLLAAPFIGDFPSLPVIAAGYTALLQPLLYLLYVLPVIVTALCYFSYSEEKDGTGLLKRMERFGRAGALRDDSGAEQY